MKKLLQGLMPLIIFSTSSVALIVLFNWLFIGVPKNPVTRAQVISGIEKQLPVGSGRKQVESWLNARKISYHYHKDNLEAESVVINSKYRPSDLDGIIIASIFDTKRSFLSKWQIVITFYFGKDGKLIDYTVGEGKNGL